MTTDAVPRDIPPSSGLRWARLDDDTDEEMARKGLRRVRTLVELRRRLPVTGAERAGVRAVTTRPFRPGGDDAGFLEVNNAAFAWHPEQGGWDADRLRRELSAEWVDTDGFLVHEDPGGTIDGFCWTRVHPPAPAAGSPPGDGASGAGGAGGALGEIWAIGTHPRAHGTGLGPALVLAGLDHLAALGVRTATLFTEEGNEPARRMYDRLGFGLHERRGGYA